MGDQKSSEAAKTCPRKDGRLIWRIGYSWIDPTPDRVRIQQRRTGHHPEADVERWPGSGRIDGRRYAAGNSLASAAPFVYVFQTIVCAGHKSADRSDPRKIGDVFSNHYGMATQSAR